MEYNANELVSMLFSVWKRVPSWLQTYITEFESRAYNRGIDAGQQSYNLPQYLERLNIQLTTELLQSEGNKILAIKALRAAKNWGLKESKDWVDSNMEFDYDTHTSKFAAWADLSVLFVQ